MQNLPDRILITGAGGSIGGEIARQISGRRLTLVDNCEYNLYRIAREIPGAAYYADIRDAARIEQIVAAERPELVIHAAALKHVAVCENNPCEAVLTNVLGTRNALDAAAECGARFLLISTDKAVRPTTVLGATKRAAEAVVGNRAPIVRFGNVVGSSGSVVPLFERQIADGGPVTVTHPDVTRYMMPIADSVRLVLAVAATALAGVHVLDMGAPVRIDDLARRMIGGRDIPIVYTGLGKGEKLHEELFDGVPVLGAIDGVFVESPPPAVDVHELVTAARLHDADAVRELIFGESGNGSVCDAFAYSRAGSADGARTYS